MIRVHQEAQQVPCDLEIEYLEAARLIRTGARISLIHILKEKYDSRF